MSILLLRRALIAVCLLPLLAACAAAPWDDPIDVTQLVRVNPKDFQARTILPKGIGAQDKANMQWLILDRDGAQLAVEDFELTRMTMPQASSTIAYRLSAKDYDKFQKQQIRQRAQLLTGYINLGLSVLPDLCHLENTTSRSGEFVYSVLVNGGNGQKITTVRVPAPASLIQRNTGLCS